MTENQECELRAAAERMGCEIVAVHQDNGISGAKGRNGRPGFDALCKAAARREFDLIMAWSVDRLGRSLQDLVGFLSEIHALRVDLYLHQEGSAVAQRMGCEIVRVHRDNGISGGKGRKDRTGFDALCRAAARREFDLIMA